MHNFKSGQKIRLVSNPLSDMPLGSIYEVAEQQNSAYEDSVCFMMKGSVTWRPARYFELVPQGPVRTETVTKRRIVPGVYGRVNVTDSGRAGMVTLYFQGHCFGPDELDELADTARQLAEALRDELD